MDTTWPALGSTTVRWQPVEGLLDLSRRAQRSTPATFEAAVVPPIAGAGLVLPGDLAADLDEATRLLATFDAGGAGEIAPFASVLLRSESAASSQIENLTSSARALAEAEIGEGHRANASVILANVRTMQAALELAGRLDEQAVLAMHRALMAQQSQHRPGRWREEQVWVGGSPLHPAGTDFVSPVADDVPALLHSVLLHTGAIHRVTVPISAGLLAVREDYFVAFGSYRAGDAEPILRCVATARAARHRHRPGPRRRAAGRAHRLGREGAGPGRIRRTLDARPARAPTRRDGPRRRA